MVSSTSVRFPSDAAGQQAVVGSRQRIVVARAWISHDAVVKQCSKYFGFQHPDFELDGSARLVIKVYFRKPHQAVCMRRPTSMKVSVVVDDNPRGIRNRTFVLYT